jgi:hypothetical protein
VRMYSASRSVALTPSAKPMLAWEPIQLPHEIAAQRSENDREGFEGAACGTLEERAGPA